jgi:DNA helicase HerA-like ATPase
MKVASRKKANPLTALMPYMGWELLADETRFDEPGLIEALPDCLAVNPGLADVQLAEISRLGHRDKFPRPHDWENLLPMLLPGEELLWIVRKKMEEEEKGRFLVYLGLKSCRAELPDRKAVTRRLNRFNVMCNSFARRCFPESSLRLLSPRETETLLGEIDQGSCTGTTLVTGIPSPKKIPTDELSEDRDEERRPFASLNDVLEPTIEESAFTLVFVVARADATAIRSRFEAKAVLRDELAPLVKQEVTGSVSKTKEEHRDTSTTESTNITYQERRSILANLSQGILGTGCYDKDGSWIPKSPWGRRPAPSSQTGSTTGRSEGESKSVQENKSVGFSRINAKLEVLDESLKLSMRHLQQTSGTGGYYGSVFVYADDPHRRSRIAGCLCSALSGAHTHIRPMQELPFRGKACNFHLHSSLAAHDMMGQLGVGIEILNTDQAGHLLLLPDADLPGLETKRSVFYGRPAVTATEELGVHIGEMAFHRPTLESPDEQASVERSKRAALRLDEDELCSHVLIVGTTGSGKTERMVHILNGISSENFRVIVLETAKKTYRNRLCRGGKTPLVYTLGDSSKRPFRINPFFFDPGTSLKRHISILADALSELLPMEALIGPKLREAIERSYSQCGWNVETGEYEGAEDPVYPDMIRFNAEVHEICRTLDDYGAEVKANYKGALLNRARIFLDEVYQDIFAFGGNKTFDDLFPKDTIIEMEEMPPSEIHMPAFIMSIVIERLRAYRAQQMLVSPEEAGPKVILVIEEAHNILHRKLEQRTGEHQAGRGARLLEQVVRLLQEGRQMGIGIMVADQSAQYLASAVVANTNTKIVYRQEDWDEVKTVGSAIGLLEEDWADLQKLQNGECIVRTGMSLRPVKLSRISSVQKPMNWNPFDGYPQAPNYFRAAKALEWLWTHCLAPEDLAKFCDAFIKWASSDYKLIRFVVGRQLALQNAQNAHEFVGRAAGIKSRDQLEELLSDTQLLLPGSMKRLKPALQQRRLARATERRK